MLKRSKLLVAFLVVTVLCASIGFAAVQETLTANGTFNMSFAGDGELGEEFKEDIYFSNAEVITTGDNVVSTGVTVDNDFSAMPDTVNIGISNTTFTAVGQMVKVQYTVQNDAAYEVKLTGTAVTNTNSQYFTVECDANNKTIAAGQTVNVVYTITLNAIPATDISNATFAVAFNVTPAN